MLCSKKKDAIMLKNTTIKIAKNYQKNVNLLVHQYQKKLLQNVNGQDMQDFK